MAMLNLRRSFPGSDVGPVLRSETQAEGLVLHMAAAAPGGVAA
jgi:hypothetical protein